MSNFAPTESILRVWGECKLWIVLAFCTGLNFNLNEWGDRGRTKKAQKSTYSRTSLIFTLYNLYSKTGSFSLALSVRFNSFALWWAFILPKTSWFTFTQYMTVYFLVHSAEVTNDKTMQTLTWMGLDPPQHRYRTMHISVPGKKWWTEQWEWNSESLLRHLKVTSV